MSRKSEAVEKHRRAKVLLNQSKYQLQVALALTDEAARDAVAAQAEVLAKQAEDLSNEARRAFR